MRKSDQPKPSIPLNYAQHTGPSRGSEMLPLGVMSLAVGIATLIVCGYLLPLMIHANDNSHSVIFLSVCLALALLLIVAAVQLCQLNSRGIALHWLHAILQLLVGIAYAWVLTLDIRESEVGMLCTLGVLPGAVLAIYPIATIIILRGLKAEEEPSKI
jgi:hypothetical protein